METPTDNVIKLEAIREAISLRQSAILLYSHALKLHKTNHDAAGALKIAADFLNAEADKLTTPYKAAN